MKMEKKICGEIKEKKIQFEEKNSQRNNNQTKTNRTLNLLMFFFSSSTSTSTTTISPSTKLTKHFCSVFSLVLAAFFSTKTVLPIVLSIHSLMEDIITTTTTTIFTTTTTIILELYLLKLQKSVIIKIEEEYLSLIKNESFPDDFDLDIDFD